MEETFKTEDINEMEMHENIEETFEDEGFDTTTLPQDTSEESNGLGGLVILGAVVVGAGLAYGTTKLFRFGKRKWEEHQGRKAVKEEFVDGECTIKDDEPEDEATEA